MAVTTMDGGEAAVPGTPAAKKSSKLLLFILAPVLLLAAGGGLLASGMLDGMMGGAAEEAPAAEARPAPGTFFQMPDIVVNLNTADRRQTFLKLKVNLELGSPEDQPMVEQLMPRILDSFQLYLRELTLDDLRGSAGAYRLREELLRRVNGAIEPARVRDVLMVEMLIQ